MSSVRVDYDAEEHLWLIRRGQEVFSLDEDELREVRLQLAEQVAQRERRRHGVER